MTETRPTKVHLQVDLNEKRNLADPADRKEAAASCLELANQFYSFVQIVFRAGMEGKCLITDIADIPMFVNQSLIVELYLKSILLSEEPDKVLTDVEVKRLRIHETDKLLMLLREEKQQAILDRFPQGCEIDSLERLRKRAEEISKAFIVLRYAYERKRLGLDYFFLMTFVAVLAEYANDVLKD